MNNNNRKIIIDILIFLTLIYEFPTFWEIVGGKTMMNFLESMMSHTLQDFLHKMGFTTIEILEIIICLTYMVVTYKYVKFFLFENDKYNKENTDTSLKTLILYMLFYTILIAIFLFLKFGII